MRYFFLLFTLFLLAACDGKQTLPVTLPDGFTVQAALATTPQQHARGLMFVKHLPENEGMLFVFEEEQPQSFWMKNTLIDLDIIFLSADGVITQLYEKVPHTYTYTPDAQVPRVSGQAQYVLEAAAGTITRHGLNSGDKITFTLP